MKRILAVEAVEKSGAKVCLAGWVHARRDHGKVIFIDLRDRSGLLQVVFAPGNDAYEAAQKLRGEWVVAIEGRVAARPANMVNPKLSTGKIELQAEVLEVLNEAKTPPFEVDKDTCKVDEERRLKYRYLDLRSERMARNITVRHEIIKFVREYLWGRGFREIETPYLTKSTPEGAREFVVPSRLYPGEFYVLPQSPQQFKQLLMVAGIERYFQIVRCFRDEDQRADRQAEFTQLDLEMSFVTREEIWELTEGMMIAMVGKIFPQKKIAKVPFPSITYEECMKKYGTDKPDLRRDKSDKDELAFAWIVDVPMFKYSKSEKKLVSCHHPFTMPHEDDVGLLETNPEKARSQSYDLVLNGFEISGGSVRIHKRKIQEKVFKILGISQGERERRFGHMLRAFEYGAPPHGGLAPGIDRIVAILTGEKVIREVMAFPKTGDARDLMMGAPSPVTERQLKDVHIGLREEARGRELKGRDTETTE